MERESKRKCSDVDVEFLILEVGLVIGGWDFKKLWFGRGGNWKKRKRRK